MSASDQSTFICPCGAMAERVASRVSMHADPNWHFGQVIDGQEINSRSQIERAEKAKGISYLSGRHDVEGMKKVAANAQKEKDEKRRTNLRKAFDQGFSGTGVLDSFGHLRPEAFKEDTNGDRSTLSVKVA